MRWIALLIALVPTLLGAAAAAAANAPPSCPTPVFSPMTTCDRAGMVLCTAAFGLWGPDLRQGALACLPENQVNAVIDPLYRPPWVNANVWAVHTQLYQAASRPNVQFWVLLANRGAAPVDLTLALMRGQTPVYPYPYRVDWRLMRAQTPGMIVALCQGDLFSPGGRFLSAQDTYQNVPVHLNAHEVKALPVSYDLLNAKEAILGTPQRGSYPMVLFRETAFDHYTSDPKDAIAGGTDILLFPTPPGPPIKRVPG